MKITVLDTCTLSNGDLDFSDLDALGEVRYADILSESEIIANYADTEAFLINKTEITKSLLSACPALRYVGTFATGYNNVDLAACKEHNVTVCNVPGYSTRAVAQHTMALLLLAAGNTDRYIESVREGGWLNSKTFSYFPFPMAELCGKTLGILGYGAIGQAVAKIGEALGMQIIVHTRTPKDMPFPAVSLQDLLRRSDYLSLHCNLNESNREILNKTTLSLMKPTAVIINTARGGLINESDLAAALNEGRIGGACLDVLTKEPMEKDNPLLFAKHCRITPHIAWAPPETRRRLVKLVAENVRQFLNGTPIHKIV